MTEQNALAARRTSFYFPKEAAAALDAIQSRTRLENGADVIRLAVLTYSRILDHIDDGSEIIVRDKNGEDYLYSPYRPFDYPGLASGAPAQKPRGASAKSFFFSGDVVEKLDKIRARGGVRTNSDAVRVALAAYRELSGVIAAKDEIIIQQRDGKEFLFDPDAPNAPQVPTRRRACIDAASAQLG